MKQTMVTVTMMTANTIATLLMLNLKNIVPTLITVTTVMMVFVLTRLICLRLPCLVGCGMVPFVALRPPLLSMHRTRLNITLTFVVRKLTR